MPQLHAGALHPLDEISNNEGTFDLSADIFEGKLSLCSHMRDLWRRLGRLALFAFLLSIALASGGAQQQTLPKDDLPEDFKAPVQPSDFDKRAVMIPMRAQAVRLSGEPTVHLVASTSGTDSDWVVKLIDV